MKKLIAAFAFSIVSLAASAQYENTTIHIDSLAPELELAMPDGTTAKLSEINKKRILLVDFWASWCGPCRRANPKLVQLYDRYKDKKFKGAKKGFEIVSVSLDKDKEAWVKAIEKDALAWPYHMSDLGFWNSKAAKTYGVAFVPQAFLIGPDGKVIGKYNFAEEAEGELQKRLKGKQLKQ